MRYSCVTRALKSITTKQHILLTRSDACPCVLGTAVPGPAQAAAFAWLGRFYREVASDAARARKCFQKSLALDPAQADAGVSEPVLSVSPGPILINKLSS